MGEMDTDGDGEVDADEFEAWWGEIGDSGTVFSGRECLAAAKNPDGCLLGGRGADAEEVQDGEPQEGRWLGDATALPNDPSRWAALLTPIGAMCPQIESVIAEVMVTTEDEERQKATAQIMRLHSTVEAKNSEEVKALFEQLDDDGNGTLDRQE